MSKYYKVDEVESLLSCGCAYAIRDLPTIEVSEEDELKFYYVDSIDDYWIGRRLDNFYYAEWVDGLGFVWTHSRYLPWGEHVVAEDTLWKEHTYPSEPREIPFTEWIVGFMKKYSVVPNVGDAISREWIRGMLIDSFEGKPITALLNALLERLDTAPSVIPKAQTETQNSNKNSNVISVYDGVSEAVRCAMCSNPNKSDRGCDGACSYDEKLYERIMKAIAESVADTSQTDCQTCKWWSSYGYCVHRECKGYEPHTERSE